MKRLHRCFGLAITALAFAACRQIEEAFRWSSDSSGSMSASESSGSGAGASVGSTYGRDVVSYTLASVTRDEADGELLRGVGRIAANHGITDWEAAPETLDAFQAVVREGQLGEAELGRLRHELAPLGPGMVAGTFDGR